MKDPGTVLKLPKSLIAENSDELWTRILKLGPTSQQQNLLVDASELQQIDETGLAFLYKVQHTENIHVEIKGLSPDIQQLYTALTQTFSPIEPAKESKFNWVETIGKNCTEQIQSLYSAIAFIGQCTVTTLSTIFQPKKIRWGEIVDVSVESGNHAIGIVCLIGFLMGVIIAFETALVAKIFGAVIFVVNGIGVAMTRELGPLMTAILFAGRSGSAFAAQLGTQKVNEELNALTTFGLDPVRFLVVPRILSSTLVVPLLSVFGTIVGVIGGGLVMGVYDITLTQFIVQLINATSVTDVLFGLVKAAIFGLVISMIGCYCGLQTGAGAAAVGTSTTRAVVLSIVWIVIIDGIAAVLMNQLGI